MIKPIGPKPTPIVFKHGDDFEEKQIVKRNTLEVIEYKDGTRALVKSTFEGDEVKDRTVNIFKDNSAKIKTFIQITPNKETGNKLDKIV